MYIKNKNKKSLISYAKLKAGGCILLYGLRFMNCALRFTTEVLTTTKSTEAEYIYCKGLGMAEGQERRTKDYK